MFFALIDTARTRSQRHRRRHDPSLVLLPGRALADMLDALLLGHAQARGLLRLGLVHLGAGKFRLEPALFSLRLLPSLLF
jgi:hypothetical protein